MHPRTQLFSEKVGQRYVLCAHRALNNSYTPLVLFITDFPVKSPHNAANDEERKEGGSNS